MAFLSTCMGLVHPAHTAHRTVQHTAQHSAALRSASAPDRLLGVPALLQQRGPQLAHVAAEVQAAGVWGRQECL